MATGQALITYPTGCADKRSSWNCLPCASPGRTTQDPGSAPAGAVAGGGARGAARERTTGCRGTGGDGGSPWGETGPHRNTGPRMPVNTACAPPLCPPGRSGASRGPASATGGARDAGSPAAGGAAVSPGVVPPVGGGRRREGHEAPLRRAAAAGGCAPGPWRAARRSTVAARGSSPPERALPSGAPGSSSARGHAGPGSRPGRTSAVNPSAQSTGSQGPRRPRRSSVRPLTPHGRAGLQHSLRARRWPRPPPGTARPSARTTEDPVTRMWSAAGTEGDPGGLLPPPGGFAAARRPRGANLVCAARLEGAFAVRDCTRAAVSGVIRERPRLPLLRMEDHLHPTLHGPAAPRWPLPPGAPER